MRLRPLAVALLLALGASLGRSEAYARKDNAREDYRKGMAQFVLEHWDAAIAEFERGFAEEPEPGFLYNIASAHRKAGRPQEAIRFYRKYLEMAPDTHDRGEVEATLRTLESDNTAATPAAVAPPPLAPAAAAPTPATVSSPAPSGSLTVVPLRGDAAGVGTKLPAPSTAASGPAAALVLGTAPPAPARLNSRRWPIWVGVGVGAAVVVGAVVTGAVLGTQPGEPVLPSESAR